MRPLVPFVLCWLLGPALLPAQERRPLVGQVHDRDGEPVAARVTLFHTEPSDGSGERTDVVTVTADGRGRFVAQVLAQRDYAAFAQSDTVMSPILGGVAAGADLTLRLDGPVADREIELQCGEGWLDRQPLRLFALPDAAHLLRVAVPLQDGRGQVPPLPGPLSFLVVDAEGEPLWLQQDGDSPLRTVRVPPPAEVPVRAEDGQGVPLAGVALAVRIAPFAVSQAGMRPLLPALRTPVWRRSGVTGADGSLRVRVPRSESEPIDQFLSNRRLETEVLATLPGHGAAIARGAGAITLTLQPAARVQLLVGGRPLSRHPLTMTSSLRVARVVTDADGFVELEGTAACTLAPEPVPASDRGVPLRAVLRLLPKPGATVDLQQLHRVRLQVLDDAGGPARGQPVALLHESGMHAAGAPICTDQAGRLEVGIDGLEWGVMLCDGDRLAWAPLPLDRSELELTLRPLPRLRCRVVDLQGQPVAGARLVRMEGTHGSQKQQGWEWVLSMLARFGNHGLMRPRRSDAQGLLELPFLPRPESRFQVRVGFGTATSELLPLRADGPLVEVVLR